MWGMWVEKLSALNFRLVSPETWKSWHWVSGNQELPPDFHLQSWQKFRTLLKAGNIWSTWNYNFPFLALIYLSLHDWTMELIRVQGNILLRRMEKSQQRRESPVLWKSWCLTSLDIWICRDIASNIQCDISVIKDHQHSKPPPGKNVEFCDLNSTRGYLSLHCEEWCHLNGESWPMYLTLWISLSKTTIKLTTDKRRPHAS